MTIEDLGGETVTRYAPSSTVMEALESFRSEQEMESNPPEDAEPKKGGLFGGRSKKTKGATPGSGTSSSDGMPDLDERSKALASLSMPSSSARRPIQVQTGWGWGMKAGIAAAIVAVVVVGYFVVAGMRSDDSGADPNRATLPNPAKRILRNGGNPMEALEAAVKAQQQENVGENQRVTEQASDAVAKEVRELLNAEPWTPGIPPEAEEIANKAHELCPNKVTRDLKAEVDKECFDYNMRLKGVTPESSDERKATFEIQLAGSGGARVSTKPVTVVVGDRIKDRFELIALGSNFATVKDTVRNDRIVTFDLRGGKYQGPGSEEDPHRRPRR